MCGVRSAALESTPGTGVGLLWHTRPMPANHVLTPRWNRFAHEANPGVLLRFPAPDGKGYRDTAYVAEQLGYEARVDELGGQPKFRTGAVYGVDAQTLTEQPSRPVGEWNDLEVRGWDNRFIVALNGVQVSDLLNQDPTRGQPVDPRFVGSQAHFGSRMSLRDVAFRRL